VIRTRTHTVFFNEEQLAPLWEEYKKLTADANDRAPHIDKDLKAAMLDRLDNLRIAIKLLGDEAD
jgi:hypothetical protein